MNSNLVASALQREKELLEQILDLAECQPELSESGRAEDLEILLSLRAAPLSELVATEEAIEATEEAIEPDMDESREMAMTTEELRHVQNLNVAILSLVDRILNLDEKTEWLVDQSDECTPAEDTAESEPSFPD